MSYHMLKGDAEKGHDQAPLVMEKTLTYRIYSATLRPLLRSRLLSWGLLLSTLALFLFAGWLAAARLVPLKMLPFDNKNEFQLVLDMPEGTTLETTDAAARALGDVLHTVPEVVDYEIYSGVASPMDFNGLVRHYYLRKSDNVAEVHVNLLPKRGRV